MSLGQTRLRGKRILYVTVVTLTTRDYLNAHVRALIAQGAEVHIAASPSPALFEELSRSGAVLHPVAIPREIALRRDLLALLALTRLMLRLRPHLLSVHHPKSGLLGGLAGVLSGVPVRLYTLHGLRFETARGARLALLLGMERLSAACAGQVICVGEDLRERAVSLGVFSASKSVVLGPGSIAGVGPQFFEDRADSDQLRTELKLPPDAWVIGFVGRVVRDKGILELAQAFALLSERFPRLHLLMIGGIEQGDAPPAEALSLLNHARVRPLGLVDQPAPYYRLMQVLALPSYREGLAGVPLEAAAAGVPSVASTATGIREVVRHQVSGLRVPVGDAGALAEAVERLLTDEALRLRLAQGASALAREFDRERVMPHWTAFYGEVLQHHLERRPRQSRWTLAALLVAVGAGVLAWARRRP